MNFYFYFIIYTFSLSLILIETQIYPIYATSNIFYVAGGSAMLTTDIGDFPVNFPTGFTISTATYRSPFVSINQIQHFSIQNNIAFYHWARVLSFTSTSFLFQLENWVITLGMSVSQNYGMMLNAVVKFRYLIVKNTFTNFICLPLIKTNILGMPINIINYYPFSLNTLCSPSTPPLTLNSSTTVFLHSFIDTEANSTASIKNGSFQFDIGFTIGSSLFFNMTVKTSFPQDVYKLGVMVFIYNKPTIQNLNMRLEYSIIDFLNIPAVYGTPIQSNYTGSYPALNSSFFYGVCKVKFSGQIDIGYNFWIGTTTNASIFEINLQNMKPTYVIPKLSLLILLASELRCPNFQPYINDNQTQCYTIPPNGTYASNTTMGLSNITVINNCISTCQTCNGGTIFNCTSCFISQNRNLSATGQCAPIPNYYDAGYDIAQICNSNCMQCVNTSTTCTECYNGTFLKNNTCITCLVYDLNCTQCNASVCTLCDIGFFIFNSGTSSTCEPCSNYSIQCSECNSTMCTQCILDYFIVSTVAGTTCQNCTTQYGVNCILCDNITCFNCTINSFFNGSYCILCATVYSTQCLQCDSTQCLQCLMGYFYNNITQLCQKIICGDGIWIYPEENCDDGNFDINDGCDSKCKTQTDFICDINDKLANGSSFCKYNKNISVQYSHLTKQETSNTIHVYFDLQPPHLKQWNLSTIKYLIQPIQIYHQNTNTSTVIPIDKITYQFYENKLTNQIQIIIDYSKFSIQESYLSFNIQPNNTNITTIQHLSSNINIFQKLQSNQNGVYLYNYSPQMYQTQQIVRNISFYVGIFALILLFLGFVMPVGKIIILQALVVVQISYFSLFQFQKIPPSYIGLKNLIYSNGYNNANLLQLNSNEIQIDPTFQLLGINFESEFILANYNLMFVVCFLLPFLTGIIGNVVNKLMEKSPLQNQVLKQNGSQKFSQKNKKNKNDLIKILLDKILYQSSFYGILISGYLIWSCAFIGIQNNSSFISMAVLSTIFIIYIIFIFKIQCKQINLKQFFTSQELKIKARLPSQYLNISTNFSDFKEVYQHLSQSKQKDYEKIYIVFILERILFCCTINILSEYFKNVSLIPIIIYSIILMIIIVIHNKSSKSFQGKKKFFKFLYKNYGLRQCLNLITIIIIQIIYLILSILVQQSNQQTFVTNQITIEIFPLAILALLILSLIINTFLWIWQIKSSKLLFKSKIIWDILFSKPQNMQVKTDRKLLKETFKKQQDQINNILNTFMQTSPIFQPRKSPFIGKQQKQQRRRKQSQSFIGLLSGQKVPENQQENENHEIQANQILKKYLDLYEQI